jgi:hypothetical protein
MADELNEVQPGDRITANLINTLIRRVKNPGGGEGTVAVPNVFGLNLGVARNNLGAAGLTVGTVLDTGGANIDVNNSANHLRLVLNQVPEPGTFVTSGQAVSLTVTAQATGTTGILVPDLFGQTLSTAKTLATSAGLSISQGFDPFGAQVDLNAAPIQPRLVLAQLPAAGARVSSGTPLRVVLSAEPVADAGTSLRITAINPSIAPMRSEVQILGTNFAAEMSDNIVMFNGVRAPEPSPQSTTSSLFVVIPNLSITTSVAGLPELSASEEGGSEIVVSVMTPSGHSPERKMRVLPPLARSLPKIQSAQSTTASTASGTKRAVRVHIQNAQEWQSLQDNRLYINGLPGGGLRTQAFSGTFGEYIFILPDSLPGVNIQSGATVLLRVWHDGFLSPAFRFTFTS